MCQPYIEHSLITSEWGKKRCRDVSIKSMETRDELSITLYLQSE